MAGGLAALAVVAAMVGPTAADPDVTAQLDAGREVATLDGPGIPAGSTLQLTLAGQDLPAGSGVVTDAQTVNLSGARIYTVGPLRASVSSASGESVDVEARLRPPEGAPWARLLSLPGAVLVLGLLFAAAYAESLLRPVLRRKRRVTTRTVIGLGAVGAVLGLVLLLTVWILGARLLSPVSVGLLLAGCALAGGLLPLGLEGDRARAGTGTAGAPRGRRP